MNRADILKSGSMRNILIGCLLLFTAIPATADGDSPIEALQKGVAEGLRILKDPEFNAADRKETQQQKLRIILEQLFDFREFSRRVLASNWKKFSPSQREEFIEVFREFLGKFYMGKLQEKYKDETLDYVGQEMKSATRALVNINVIWKGRKIPVDLRMIKRRGVWKVYDIQLFGISAVRNYRAQFKALLRKETPARVIELMKAKIKKTDSEKPSGSGLKDFKRLTLFMQIEYDRFDSIIYLKRRPS